MKSILGIIGLTGSALLLAACSSGRSEEAGTSSKLVAQLAPNYAFALQVDIRGEAGNTITVKLLGKVEINEQDGEDVDLSLHPCSLVLPEVGGYKPFVDDSFLQDRSRVPAVIYSGTLGENGVFTAPTEAILFGVRNLANPVTDPIPANPSSPQIYDQDGDGKPGVSIKIDTGFLGVRKVYGAARLLAGFEGALAGNGNIVGTADGDFALKVFGDDIPLIDVASLAEEALASSSSVPRDARFIAIPQGANLTCADVKRLNPQVPATIAPPPEATEEPEATAGGESEETAEETEG